MRKGTIVRMTAAGVDADRALEIVWWLEEQLCLTEGVPSGHKKRILGRIAQALTAVRAEARREEREACAQVIAAARAEARREEREACAKLADPVGGNTDWLRQVIAAAIRGQEGE